MSVYCKHKATALDFLKFMESDAGAAVPAHPGLAGAGVDGPVHRPDAGRQGSRTCRRC